MLICLHLYQGFSVVHLWCKFQGMSREIFDSWVQKLDPRFSKFFNPWDNPAAPCSEGNINRCTDFKNWSQSKRNILNIREVCNINLLNIHKTNSPKGNDCSPESSVPRSNLISKNINGPWKPEARNRTRPSFYACLGYLQL